VLIDNMCRHLGDDVAGALETILFHPRFCFSMLLVRHREYCLEVRLDLISWVTPNPALNVLPKDYFPRKNYIYEVHHLHVYLWMIWEFGNILQIANLD